MPRLAANLSMMFGEVDFLDRFEAARRHGFQAVEFLFPYAYAAKDLVAARRGLDVALFNAHPGNWEKGERGIAALEGREEEFRATFESALDYARELACRRIHVMSGIASGEGARRRYVERLQRAAERCVGEGIDLLVEPLNPHDVQGYLVPNVATALAIIASVDRPNVRLQLDLYHVGMNREDPAETLGAALGRTAHIQVAGVPGRHEPDDSQEVDYPALFALMDGLAYEGWVGCEYRPRSTTVEGLGWAKPFGIRQSER